MHFCVAMDARVQHLIFSSKVAAKQASIACARNFVRRGSFPSRERVPHVTLHDVVLVHVPMCTNEAKRQPR